VRREKRARVTLAAFSAVLALCALFSVSCSRSDRKAGFSQKLASIDTLVSAGDKAKALNKLESLRSSAQSASQWLGIARRERDLDDYAHAETTLRKAMRKLPANESITAVLVDTLIERKKYTEAAGFTDILRSTPYTPLAAYAGIRAGNLLPDTTPAGPQWWVWAFEATGNPAFLRNAAVLHAASGNFAAACALFADSSGFGASDADATAAGASDAYFRALLCYDAKFYDRVFSFLPQDDLVLHGAEEVVLMADTAMNLGDIPLGRLLWGTLALKSPAFSPVPYYNLSATSENPQDEKTGLETCLSLFPSYYPAVVRYVRSVPQAKETEGHDPVTQELERAGFLTLDMEEGLLNTPVDAQTARSVLERAIELSGKTVDMRLRIEDFRFAQAQNTDRLRSASDMWKFLETAKNDPEVHRYAIWYFSSIGNFDASFTLNQGLKDKAQPFYAGLEAAFGGDLDLAVERFSAAADGTPGAWRALANIARIREKKHDYAAAIEDLSIATGMTDDDRIKSRLQYDTARMLLELRMTERAASIAGYALELDPSNYRASLLLGGLGKTEQRNSLLK